MLFGIGVITVMVCVFGGYVAMGGHLMALNQPMELVIIGGAGLGAYMISNSGRVLKGTLSNIKKVMKGPPYSKTDYLELLSLLYQVMKLVKSKGVLAIESHIENPKDSALFQQFPKFHSDHHAVDFLCDYLRLWTLGMDNPNEMEDLINEDIETHHAELHEVGHAVQNLGDAFPALGIVAAVLGIIKTMGAISEPPEVLGKLIGGALVGTFLGILIAYGFVGPMAASLNGHFEAEGKYYQCIKAGLLAHMNGCAPAVSIEFARKTLTSDVRPSFYEVEETVGQLPPPA
jgi:chemotaxis protein MotA